MKTHFRSFFEDALIKIFGKTTTLSKATREIDELAEPIMLHLALIAAYPGSVHQHQWSTVLDYFLSRVVYYQNSCKVEISESKVLQLVYDKPLGDLLGKAIALSRARTHIKKDQNSSAVEVENTAGYYTYPFKATLACRLKALQKL